MDINELLSRFVATSWDNREVLKTPILRDRRVYATNGHIMIRVPMQEGIKHHVSALPKNLNLFPKAIPGKLATIPKLPPAKPCRTCSGTGVAEGEPCDDCEGTGVNIRQGIDVGDSHFAHRYLSKIVDLPGLKFWTSGSRNMALFHFDGGEGLLMPLRRTT